MKPSQPQKAVVFTDLDGTLLTHEYSYSEVNATINHLLSLDTSVVFASSKTRKEIEFYTCEMNVHDPFISENGAAIFVPHGYFKSEYSFAKKTPTHDVIELGVPYAELRSKLEKAQQQTSSKVIGFGDLSVKEVAEDTGLPLGLAELAKAREYDEPFRVVEGDEKKLFAALEAQGLRVTKGDRYSHLTGRHSKGTAVELLKRLYFQEFGQVKTFGVGNGPNDFEMLEVVDVPVFVAQTDDIEAIWKKILADIMNLNF
ncbi:MAG: HAD-IIB family hydrolase [Candidatus Bathyarchaeota archaeon]|nr:HAD-IIB family hydrolase [Candidatus Bathyarchaeota archaeon]